MIQGEFFLRERAIAVLADILVAQKDIFTREFYTETEIGLEIAFEAENRGQLEGGIGASHFDGMIFKNLDFALEPQSHRFLPVNDTDRLVTGI